MKASKITFDDKKNMFIVWSKSVPNNGLQYSGSVWRINKGFFSMQDAKNYISSFNN